MKPSLGKLDEEFFAKFKLTQKFKKNQLIFGPGSEPSGVFFVKSGFVRLYLISESGKELTFNIIKPGAYFPMIWALNNTPNVYFFESMTDNVLLLKAPRDEVVKHIESHPDVLYDLTKRILSGLSGQTKLMEALLTGNAYQQVASVLLVLARRFGKNSKDSEIIIDIPLTHRIIGTLASLSRESTSLELEKLMRDKIISQKDHLIVVRDLRRLEEKSPISFIEEAIF